MKNLWIAVGLCAALVWSAPGERVEWKPVHVEGRFSGPVKKGGLLELRISIAPGWEISSNTPPDESSYPCTLELELPGVTFGQPVWPAAEQVPIPELGMEKSIFTGKIAVIVPIVKGAIKNPQAARGTLRYQSCQGKICHPPDAVPFEISSH